MQKSSKFLLLLALFEVFFLIISALFGIHMITSIMLCVWLNLMVYAATNIKKRIVLFMFGITFFNFLLGREILQRYFNYQVDDIAEHINLHAEQTIIISLIIIFVCYCFFEKVHITVFGRKRRRGLQTSRIDVHYIQKVSKLFFYLSVVCAILYSVIVGLFTISSGYFQSYTGEFNMALHGNPIILALSKMDSMMPVFLAVYFATRPSLKKCRPVIVCYFFYLAVSLLSGQRSTFVIGLLWICIYFVFRSVNSNEKWIDKKVLILGILILPVGIVLLDVIGQIRSGNGVYLGKVLEVFPRFFHQQGVSINVIKRSFEFADRLPENRLFSMTFISEGILGKLLGFPVYPGNSVEHAQQGYSLAHSLSYIMLGSRYLAGQGTGTSYIAELYHDFGYIGIVVGNIIYSWFMVKATRIKTQHVYSMAALLLMIRQLLWSPRGGFSELLLVLLQTTTPVALLVVWFIVYLLKKRDKHIYKKARELE